MTPSQSSPPAPVAAVPSRSRQPQRQPQQQQQQQQFANFSPQQNIQPAFAPQRAVPPPARPALTFQDPAPQQQQQQRPRATAAPPANLPKSALEVVDFNQLLQEFQGGRASQFPAQPAVPAVFQSSNFPTRYRY